VVLQSGHVWQNNNAICPESGLNQAGSGKFGKSNKKGYVIMKNSQFSSQSTSQCVSQALKNTASAIPEQAPIFSAIHAALTDSAITEMESCRTRQAIIMTTHNDGYAGTLTLNQNPRRKKRVHLMQMN
jgi:hypothetical protein